MSNQTFNAIATIIIFLFLSPFLLVGGCILWGPGSAPPAPTDYRAATTGDWVLRAKADLLELAPFGPATLPTDLFQAVVGIKPNGAAVWMKVINVNNQAARFYKVTYTVNPATGAATLTETLPVPGYPK